MNSPGAGKLLVAGRVGSYVFLDLSGDENASGAGAPGNFMRLKKRDPLC